jgi:TPR repeat protein
MDRMSMALSPITSSLRELASEPIELIDDKFIDVLELEKTELSNALVLENQNDFEGAMSKYIFLFERGTSKSQNQFLAMLVERGGAEHAYNYCMKQCSENSIPLGVRVCLGIMYFHGLGVPQDYHKARELLMLAANEGNAIALTNLGEIYLKGHGVRTNYQQALTYFKNAANQGNAIASLKCGEIYHQGLGVKPNPSKAMEYVEDAVNGGIDTARGYLEILQKQVDELREAKELASEGNDFFQQMNYGQAYDCFKLASEKGNVTASLRLWEMYRNGICVDQDDVRAHEYLMLAAKGDWSTLMPLNVNPIALTMMGSVYLKGDGVAEDYRLARMCFEAAAEQGNTFAAIKWAEMNLYALGGPLQLSEVSDCCLAVLKSGNDIAIRQLENLLQDYFEMVIALGNASELCKASEVFRLSEDLDKAYACSELAAEKGSVLALFHLGEMNYKAVGVSQNYEKAMAYFLKMVTQKSELEWGDLSRTDFNNGIFYISDMYIFGLGVKQDYEVARKFLVIAANEGDLLASTRLGMMHLMGLGGDRDIYSARFYFEKAKSSKDGIALNYLGMMDCNAQNYFSARLHFESSAAKGNDIALINLGIMNFNGLGVPRDYAQAFRFFKQAADNGIDEALNRLGAFYFVGRSLGVEKDLDNAFDLFKQAADKGNANAMDNVGNMYLWGTGVQKDSSKAEEYFRKADECRKEEGEMFKSSEPLLSIDSLMHMPLNGNRSYQLDNLWFH